MVHSGWIAIVVFVACALAFAVTRSRRGSRQQ